MPRILLADDHFRVRCHVRDTLQRQQGWEVCAEASNGREAVEMTAAHKPDIAVLDLSMPELNGLQAAREIRARFPETVVLILTMHNAEAFLHEALASGARACLSKCNLQCLVDEVRKIWSDRQIANCVPGSVEKSEPGEKDIVRMRKLQLESIW
jgi:DNA-binding NarL/FixJ family response regulator